MEIDKDSLKNEINELLRLKDSFQKGKDQLFKDFQSKYSESLYKIHNIERDIKANREILEGYNYDS